MTQDPTPAELSALLNGPRDTEAREQIRAIMRRKRMAAEQFMVCSMNEFAAAKHKRDKDGEVFDAMMNAGTPCPVDGKIGAEAKAVWDADPARIPASVREK